jgi:hypothetical protein
MKIGPTELIILTVFGLIILFMVVNRKRKKAARWR